MDGREERGEWHLAISNITVEDDARYQCQVGATETVQPIRSSYAVVTEFKYVIHQQPETLPAIILAWADTKEDLEAIQVRSGPGDGERQIVIRKLVRSLPTTV